MQCPNCGNSMQIKSNSKIGDIIICSNCRIDFEIIKRKDSEVILRQAEKERSDWGQ